MTAPDSGSTPKPYKSVYTTPTLVVFGGLRELTLAKDFGPKADGSMIEEKNKT